MKTWIHFLSEGKSQLGCDAWLRVDGRCGLAVLCTEAKEQIFRKRFVQPHYNGFEIHVGEKLTQTRVLYRDASPLLLYLDKSKG